MGVLVTVREKPSAAQERQPKKGHNSQLDTMGNKALDTDTASESVAMEVTDLSALLTRLQLRFVHRSPRSMWLGKRMDVKVELSPAQLSITMKEQEGSSTTKARRHHRLHRELVWRDVLGAHILTQGGEHLNAPIDVSAAKDNRTYLLGVYACPAAHQRKEKVAAGARKKRRLLELFYEFQGDQLQDVDELRKWINFLADPRTESQLTKVQSVGALTLEERPVRKFLAIINPVGGAGKGVQTYENKVAPVLKYAGIDVTVEITKQAGHATEIITNLPLDVYDCVFSVGGDGSLSESKSMVCMDTMICRV